MACFDTEEDDRFSLDRLTELSHRSAGGARLGAEDAHVPWLLTPERAAREPLIMKHWGSAMFNTAIGPTSAVAPCGKAGCVCA